MSDLDYGIRTGSEQIFVGQSADDFKSRLGCVQRPLSIFVKMRSRVLHGLLRIFAPLFFPPHKLAPPRDLFKTVDSAVSEPAQV